MKSFLTIPRLLALSFAAVILAGALALLAPPAISNGHARLAFIDALFTATSAVCVTGLTVRDTGSEFGPWGQATILALIQMGGLGILTFSNLIFLAQSGRLGLRQRFIVEETHGALPSVSPAMLLRKIVKYTFAIELAGAAILTARFCADYSFGQALWLGMFHAVSAFCNAGFSLFTLSLTGYRDDPTINFTIMGLIVLGGLGFVVFADLSAWARRLRRRPRPRLSLHSKAAVWTTLILIVAGATLIGALELTGDAMGGSWRHRAMQSLFLSISARTAGYNSIDTGQLTNATLLIVILLMIAGASPGSTGGGIKTTTCATLFALVISRARNRPKVELFERSIPMATVAKALTTTTGFLAAMVIAVILLQITELGGLPHAQHRGRFLEHLFEVVSALGTVGLSTGVTATLTSAGKLVIIGCMFLGRLGPLIVAASLIGARERIGYSYPEESVIIG